MKLYILLTFLIIPSYPSFVVGQEDGGKPYQLSEVPSIISNMISNGSDGAWVALSPEYPGPNSEDFLNVEFSIRNGVLGLDWLLLNEVNIRDKEKFLEFSKDKGFSFNQFTNKYGIEQFRSEEKGLGAFSKQIFIEMYNFKTNDLVFLVSEGLEHGKSQ